MIFCKLVLADGSPVGTINIPSFLTKDFAIAKNGKSYRIVSGRLLEPEPGEHVSDRLLLTVKEIREKGRP